MHSLTKSYNRRFYRKVMIIHLIKWLKIARCHFAGWLLKLAFKIEPKLYSSLRFQILKKWEENAHS